MLARPRAGMMLITYRRLAVAMAGPDRIYLAPHIDQCPDGDPLKRFVCFLALYARDVQTGRLPAEPRHYTARRAEHYAREALIPLREFVAAQHRSHRQFRVFASFRARAEGSFAGSS